MAIDIAGFGVATLDMIAEVERFPAAGEKAKILSREYHGGGLTATALVAASKLGASCWYGGALGRNESSDFVRNALREYGVMLPAVTFYPPEAEPFLSSVYVEKNSGERTILWSEFLTPAPVLNDETVGVALSAKSLFVDRFFAETLLPLYRQARAQRIPIIGDFEAIANPHEEEALTLVDHLVVPAAFAREYTGTDDVSSAVLKLLREHDRSAVVITDGVKGAWFAEKGDSAAKHQAAFQVPVCDTTGCGDVFHGAYAAALTFGMTLAQRVRFASAAAALKATKKGGQAAAPTREELETFLAKTPQSG